MTVQFLGPDPVEAEVAAVLQALSESRPIEHKAVDLKEESGRRKGGVLAPSQPRNEGAAKHLATEAACMANTPGGGALIVGAADDGTLVGTDLDYEWLRARIYDLTQRKVTADIKPVLVNGVRLLVLRMVEAVEPVKMNGKIHWRVDTNCVEVDNATWLSGRLHRLGYDPSAEATGWTVADARPGALERARQYLRQTGEGPAMDLAAATDEDLLRRLNGVTATGNLTVAAALLFVGRDTPALDYIRRRTPGGDSTKRLRQPGVSVLEELHEIERAFDAANETLHLPRGLAIAQFEELPELAVREAIVNGIAHRDWQSEQPTTIEHTGATLVVTSPGGFIGGVNPSNIITHPSQPRNRALAELLASLRVAEREGIGVDRMVREMVRLGRALPHIEETAGPNVRTALVGGTIDEEWVTFLSALSPARTNEDLDALLLLRRLADIGWVDATTAAPDLQRSEAETRAAISRLEQCTHDGRPVIVRVDGVPPDAPAAWRLSDHAQTALSQRLTPLKNPAGRAELATHWARARGRISSTELADLSGIAANHAGNTLKQLEEDGVLAAGRASRIGRGFFYIPADAAPQA